MQHIGVKPLLLQLAVNLLQDVNNMNFFLWITGLSGAGKTTIGKKVYESISDQRVVFIDGDEIRKVIQCFDYDYVSRKNVSWQIHRFCKLLLNQNISVICCTMSLFEEIYDANSQLNCRFSYIYIDADIKIRQSRRSDIYRQTDLVGVDIPFFKPDNCLTLKNEVLEDIDKNSQIILAGIKFCSQKK